MPPLEPIYTLIRRQKQGRTTSTGKHIGCLENMHTSMHSTHLTIGCLSRLVSRETGLTSAAPLLRGYAKLETLTIAELNAFISSASSQVRYDDLHIFSC